MRRLVRVLLVLLVVIGCGCASTTLTPQVPAPKGVERFYELPAWAEDEIVDVLRAYLRVDTTNPPGNETRGAEFRTPPKPSVPSLATRSAGMQRVSGR